jgi:very-short-patch-repair endonuclease
MRPRYWPAVQLACRAVGLPAPVPEYRFAPPRRWRFDFAWPTARTALEVDGGIWVQGRHSRGSGLIREHEKMNAAATRGWAVFRCTPHQVGDLGLYRHIKERVDDATR